MPADEFDAFPDAEQLLAGSPARRAAALLFLIETRTTRLVKQSRQRMEPFLTDEAAQERSLAFVEAFALARDVAVQPTIQELERHASQWAPLVTRNARLQAALAHRLAEKYRFTARVVPALRAALGLDETDVRDAYQELYGKPLEKIYAGRLSLRERLRWAWTTLAKRLETLPPFWTAYSLTLTETVGASILALPIAVASIGPLAGVAILVVLGLVNMLTVSFIAEAVVRSGPMRYGNAFFGRLVADYLGRGGSLALSVLLFLLVLLALPVFYVGFGTMLEDVTSVPAAVWVALLFLAAVFYVRRESLDATVATALVVGAVNLGLILGLSLLAFANARGDYLLHAESPFADSGAFDASIVAVVFGVVLVAYFGHTSVAICGSLVLRRDPSGRSLIHGCAAAQATAIVVYCLFVLAANGAVGPDRLAGEAGTALSPLADAAGIGVDILGTAFVVLGLGMTSITFSLALTGLTRERLPSISPRIVALPRRRAQLVFEGRRNRIRVGVTYLGPGGGGSRFAVDVERDERVERTEAVAAGLWNVLPAEESRRHRLALELLDADEWQARVAVISNLRMVYEGELDPGGFGLGEVVDLADAEAGIVGWLARHGDASMAEVVARTGGNEEHTVALLRSLVGRGLVEQSGAPGDSRFSARMAPRRPRASQVWNALADGEQTTRSRQRRSVQPARAPGLKDVLLGRTGRFALATLPLLAAFVVGEWMVITGSGSFAGLLGFIGVIVVSILAGLFPVLLLLSSRRKGEHTPRTEYAFLGARALLGAVYVLFLTGLFAHGLVIWDDPAERAGALAAGVAMLALPVLLARSGAFRHRLTVEVRDDQRAGRAVFASVAAGQRAEGEVRLHYAEGEGHLDDETGEIPDFGSLLRALFQPRRTHGVPPAEVKIWAHRVTPEGESESLRARARVCAGGHRREADVSLSRGEALFRVTDRDVEVEIELKDRAER